MIEFNRVKSDSLYPVETNKYFILHADIPGNIDDIKIKPMEVKEIPTGLSITSIYSNKLVLPKKLIKDVEIISVTGLNNPNEEIIVTLKNYSNKIICIEDEDEIIKLMK